MAEDWASIAYRLFPRPWALRWAALVAGLYGFSKGVSGSAENRLETERYNKQIEFKNIDDRASRSGPSSSAPWSSSGSISTRAG